jgi:hypothetical protein
MADDHSGQKEFEGLQHSMYYYINNSSSLHCAMTYCCPFNVQLIIYIRFPKSNYKCMQSCDIETHRTFDKCYFTPLGSCRKETHFLSSDRGPAKSYCQAGRVSFTLFFKLQDWSSILSLMPR